MRKHSKPNVTAYFFYCLWFLELFYQTFLIIVFKDDLHLSKELLRYSARHSGALIKTTEKSKGMSITVMVFCLENVSAHILVDSKCWKKNKKFKLKSKCIGQLNGLLKLKNMMKTNAQCVSIVSFSASSFTAATENIQHKYSSNKININ